MFTGIIEAQGEVVQIKQQADDWQVRINVGVLDMADVCLGDSVAVDGVCLTVVQFDRSHVVMDVSAESLSKTTWGSFKVGRKVNLEKALTPTTRLGGHLVSGHVDAVAVVVARERVGDSIRFSLQVPDALAKYIAVKGSICIDGVSLTVNAVDGSVFDINVIPHTADVTGIGGYHIGCEVNIEIDVIARYLERLLLGDKAANGQTSNINQAFLAENGFLKQI